MCRLTRLIVVALVSGSGFAATEPRKSHEDFAAGVYERLIRVLGSGLPPPALHVQTDAEAARLPAERRAQERVAFLRSVPGTLGKRQIVIDEKTVRLCRSAPQTEEACVAYFLGHELAHYANHHDWGPHFALKMAGVTSAQSIASADLKENAAREAQADDLGMLYAALAGYDTMAVAPQALAVAYKAYEIPEALPGYLTLAERQQIAERSRASLQTLLPLFDAATVSMTLGQFEAAAAIYDAILERFPSREMYNNAAVARARTATAADEASYPWLLDGLTRLPRTIRRGGTVEPAKREALLKAAADNLDRAMALDSEYAVARVNRGLIGLAQGETNRARAELESARKLARGSAVIASAVEAGEALASGRPLSAAGTPGSGVGASPAIGRSELRPGGRSPKQGPAKPSVIDLPGGLTLSVATMPQHRWFSIRFPGEAASIAALVMGGPGSASAGPLHVGMSRDEWAPLLGAPTADIALFPARTYSFQSLGLLLQVDESDRVREIIVYQ